MNFTKDNEENAILSIYQFSLNNIQKIISRLSNIGFILLSTSITTLSIIAPIIFTLNDQTIKIVLGIMLLLITFILFICNLINLKNERIFRKIYDEKTKINIFEYNDPDILKNKF